MVDKRFKAPSDFKINSRIKPKAVIDDGAKFLKIKLMVVMSAKNSGVKKLNSWKALASGRLFG